MDNAILREDLIQDIKLETIPQFLNKRLEDVSCGIQVVSTEALCAYIWSYGGSNAKDYTADTYLYPHTQVDAQVSYWIPRGHGMQLIVSGLNLNNEVFGFYNGNESSPIQREYYGRTISVGMR